MWTKIVISFSFPTLNPKHFIYLLHQELMLFKACIRPLWISPCLQQIGNFPVDGFCNFFLQHKENWISESKIMNILNEHIISNLFCWTIWCCATWDSNRHHWLCRKLFEIIIKNFWLLSIHSTIFSVTVTPT